VSTISGHRTRAACYREWTFTRELAHVGGALIEIRIVRSGTASVIAESADLAAGPGLLVVWESRTLLHEPVALDVVRPSVAGPEGIAF
jgi:hypothetical protein